MSGFVKIHRSLIGNPQFRGKNDEYAAIWLVIHATWKETTIRIARQPVKLIRGQCAYAMSYLAEAWECSKATAYRLLKHLENTGFLETRAERGFTVITICKYDQYQVSPDENETQDETLTETPGETRVKRERNAGETNKKNLKKDNKDSPSVDDDFERWWSQVPKKVSKGSAKTAFRTAIKKANFDDLLAGIVRYAGEVDGRETKFIAHPATWLRAERWLDDAPKVEPEKPTNWFRNDLRDGRLWELVKAGHGSEILQGRDFGAMEEPEFQEILHQEHA